MFLAETEASTWALLVVLAAAIVRSITSDIIWRGVIHEVRDELKDCRDGREEQRKAHSEERSQWRSEKTQLEVELQNLQGEVIALRRTVHADYWTGITPKLRPSEEEK